MQLWNWRGLDVINAHERDPAVYLRGDAAAVAAVAAGALDPRPLYTHTFPLEGLGDALAATARPARRVYEGADRDGSGLRLGLGLGSGLESSGSNRGLCDCC